MHLSRDTSLGRTRITKTIRKMSKVHEVLRAINGTLYRCRDIGCDDFDRAARNRLLISSRLFTTAYQFVESYLEHAPLRLHLPRWLEEGGIYKYLSGDRGGDNEEETDIVVSG